MRDAVTVRAFLLVAYALVGVAVTVVTIDTTAGVSAVLIESVITAWPLRTFQGVLRSRDQT